MPAVQVQTPLGSLRIRATARTYSALSGSMQLWTMVPQLSLPNGVTVDGVEAVVLIAQSKHLLEQLVFECIWVAPPCEGSPESGECLDAQSWEHSGHIVMVGTEDLGALRSRLPYIFLPEEPYPIEYLADGIRIVIPTIAADQRLSLHFVVAHNRLPEPVECSTWVAVDVRHAELIAKRSGGSSLH